MWMVLAMSAPLFVLLFNTDMWLVLINVLTVLKWLNLVMDMKVLVSETWKGQMYSSVESVCLSANCRLRRIFTMRSQPPDTTDDEGGYVLGRAAERGAANVSHTAVVVVGRLSVRRLTPPPPVPLPRTEIPENREFKTGNSVFFSGKL